MGKICNNKSDNIKRLRNFYNMTQTQFIEYFLQNEDEDNIISLSTYSNLENKGGKKLDLVIQNICKKLEIDASTFLLEPGEFIDYIDTNFSNSKIIKKINEDKLPNIGNIVDQLTNYFADLIIKGELKPGDQIKSDRQMSITMGISRSLIREGLKVLQLLGLIDIRPGQGTYISSKSSDFFHIPLSWAMFLNAEQTDEIIQLRNSLEFTAVELASKNDDPTAIAKLTDVFNESTIAYKNKDFEKFLETDIKFHLTIAECSGNTLIFNLLKIIQNLLKKISSTGLKDISEIDDVYKEHLLIYGSILLNNDVEARENMKKHASQAYKRYEYIDITNNKDNA